MLDYAIKLNQHTTIDMRNEEGWTPAHLAGFLNNFDALNLLIENGADLSARSNNNLTTYQEIIRADNGDLLECIYPLIKGFEKKRSMKAGNFSLLHLAASSNGQSCLHFLLEKTNEYPNQFCNETDKSTPLHFATISKSAANARLLLAHGANPNAQDSYGNSPLHYAVSNQSSNIVRILHDHGADGLLQNLDHTSPLDISISEDIRDIKMYFMGKQKYANYDFSMAQEAQNADEGPIYQPQKTIDPFKMYSKSK